MGTVATAQICDPPDPRLLDEVFTWLHEVDRRFSPFLADSEVCQLDRGELPESGYSDEMRHVLAECGRLWKATDGYFDPYASGHFDPSGYVKGWAVQVASERLSAAGAGNHLIDAGGDLQTRGRPGDGLLWTVGVRHPWELDKVGWVLAGTDLAVATSGTYERGAHVFDPRSGGCPTELRSVTVVGRDLAEADAYATAAIAMGRAGLSWLAGLPGYEVAVVAEDGTAYVSAGLPVVTD
jgi:thiamine biosynthesis lipoprotein